MTERKHYIRTNPSTWRRRGFLPQESLFLAELTREGMKAPHIQAMMRRRSSLNANRVKYGWTAQEYRERVVAEYAKRGIRQKSKYEPYTQYLKTNFYKLFKWYQREVPAGDWETPRKKRVHKVTGKIKAQATKKQQLMKKKEDWNDKIVKAMKRGDQPERARLERERNQIQTQLDNLR